jgi:hypothetical protein
LLGLELEAGPVHLGTRDYFRPLRLSRLLSVRVLVTVLVVVVSQWKMRNNGRHANGPSSCEKLVEGPALVGLWPVAMKADMDRPSAKTMPRVNFIANTSTKD